MAFSQEFPVARARLQWTAWGLVLCMALNLTRQVGGFQPVLLVANLALIAIAAAVGEATRRGRITTVPQVNACGGGLAALLGAITLVAYVIRQEPVLLVMLSLQFVAVGALFFSTPWVLWHLGATTLAALAVIGFKPYALLVSTSAVLGLTLHMAIRDRQSRRDSVYAAELEAALEQARHQLHDKERAEAEREAALQDSARYQEQLLQSQKMEAIGTLAGGLAHDMNNALAGILGLAECIASATPDDQVREDAQQIMQSAQRAADLTRNLLGFSRRGQYRSERICARPLVASVVALIRRTLPKGVTVATSIADELAAFDGDTSLLSHALVNLCINASDAMSGTRHARGRGERRLAHRLGRTGARARDRSLRRALGARHRLRDGRGHARADLRAILHHQGARARHRPRAGDGVRHGPASLRRHRGGQRARARHHVSGSTSPPRLAPRRPPR